MNPSRHLLQVLHRIGQPRYDTGKLGSEVVVPVDRNLGLHGAQSQTERDEPLLRAVVEVSLDSAASLVRCGDDPPARGGELRPVVRIRDGSGDQPCELLQTLFEIERKWLFGG